MRKTTASQPPKDRGTFSRKQPGLMGQGTNAQGSAKVRSALANRFHRTLNWVACIYSTLCRNLSPPAPARPVITGSML